MLCSLVQRNIFSCLGANMEQKEQDVCMMNPSINQPHARAVRAEESRTVQDSPPQTTEVFKSRNKQNKESL